MLLLNQTELSKTRQGVPPRTMTALQRMGQSVHYGAGWVLAYPDLVPDYCYLLLEGRVMALVEADDGSRRILHCFEAGQLLLAQNLLTGRTCGLEFRVFMPSRLRRITYAELSRIMRERHDIMLDVVDAMADYSDSVIQKLLCGMNRNATVRVCNQLLDMAAVFGTDAAGNILLSEKMTQAAFADLVGIHRVTVSREIKKLKELGLLHTVGGYFSLPNVAELVNYRDQQEQGGNEG